MVVVWLLARSEPTWWQVCISLEWYKIFPYHWYSGSTPIICWFRFHIILTKQDERTTQSRTACTLCENLLSSSCNPFGCEGYIGREKGQQQYTVIILGESTAGLDHAGFIYSQHPCQPNNIMEQQQGLLMCVNLLCTFRGLKHATQ